VELQLLKVKIRKDHGGIPNKAMQSSTDHFNRPNYSANRLRQMIILNHWLISVARHNGDTALRHAPPEAVQTAFSFYALDAQSMGMMKR
jgi:hypothetical protein